MCPAHDSGLLTPVWRAGHLPLKGEIGVRPAMIGSDGLDQKKLRNFAGGFETKP